MSVARVDPLAALRQRSSEKWQTFPPDVLPMFVAEMDFGLSPVIKAALHEALERGDTGYVDPHDTRAMEAFADFAREAWGWSASPDRMRCGTDVSVVIVESLRRLIAPGQGVVINPPIYPPFFDLVAEAGGTVVEVALLDHGIGFQIDLDGIERALADGAGGVLLCNPHNPVGLLHSREELTALSEIVARHDGFVVSDEIHAPLTHHGRTFTPYLTVSDHAREHGIAAESASKAFNLAGLKCALFVADGERMATLISSLPQEVIFRTGLFGLIATRAGFADSRDWLDATIAAIESNIDLVATELAGKLPAVRVRRPDASYLVWLDMARLGWGDDPAAMPCTPRRSRSPTARPSGRRAPDTRGSTSRARPRRSSKPSTDSRAPDRQKELGRRAAAHCIRPPKHSRQPDNECCNARVATAGLDLSAVSGASERLSGQRLLGPRSRAWATAGRTPGVRRR